MLNRKTLSYFTQIVVSFIILIFTISPVATGESLAERYALDPRFIGEYMSCWEADLAYKRKTDYFVDDEESRNRIMGACEEKVAQRLANVDQQQRQMVENGGQQQDGGDTDLERKIDSQIDICREKKKSATICCQDPIKCIDEDSDFSLGNMQLITALAQAGSAFGGGGVKEACERAKKLNDFGSVANTAMAVTCQTQKGRCEDNCEDLKAKLDQYRQDCKTQGGAKSTCDLYARKSREVKREISSCQSLAGQVTTMGLQAISQASAAKGAAICADQAASDDSLVGSGDLQTDCSDPANASNPFCKSCSDPANADDPVCQQVSASSGSYNPGQVYDSASEYGSPQGFDVSDDGLVGNQGTNFASTEAVASKSSGVGRGGGGVPGGGGGAAPFAGGGKGGGSQKSRLKTDTLHGLSGGGGYSPSGGGFSSGGYGSGSSSRDYAAKKRMKKFNLKDFVPNVHKPLLDRAPSGQIARDIGSKNSKNIFQRVSDVFFRHCRQGDFFDCSKIRKQNIVLPVLSGQSLSIPSSRNRNPSNVALGKNKQNCVTGYKKRYCIKKYKNASCYKKASLYCK